MSTSTFPKPFPSILVAKNRTVFTFTSIKLAAGSFSAFHLFSEFIIPFVEGLFDDLRWSESCKSIDCAEFVEHMMLINELFHDLVEATDITFNFLRSSRDAGLWIVGNGAPRIEAASRSYIQYL